MWKMRFALPFILAATLAAPAYAHGPFIQGIYEAHARSEAQKNGYRQVNEKDFVVTNNNFEISVGAYIEVFGRKNPSFPADAVAYWNPDNPYDMSNLEWRERVSSDLHHIENYPREKAEFLAQILTGGDHIVMSESGIRAYDHEKMHRILHYLPYGERTVIRNEWIDALKRNRIASRRAADIRFDEDGSLLPPQPDECNRYCRDAKRDMHHFVIYLCQGLIVPHPIESPVREIISSVCIPPRNFGDGEDDVSNEQIEKERLSFPE